MPRYGLGDANHDEPEVALIQFPYTEAIPARGRLLDAPLLELYQLTAADA